MVIIIITMINIIEKKALSLFSIQDWPYKEVIKVGMNSRVILLMLH